MEAPAGDWDASLSALESVVGFVGEVGPPIVAATPTTLPFEDLTEGIITGIFGPGGDDGATTSTTEGSSTATTTSEGTTTSEPVSTTTSEFDLTPLTDDSGRLTIEVPREWSEVSADGWLYQGATVGPGLAAAPDLQARVSGFEVSGVFVGASETLGIAPADLLDDN